MERVRPRRQIDASSQCTLEQINGGKASRSDGVGKPGADVPAERNMADASAG